MWLPSARQAWRLANRVSMSGRMPPDAAPHAGEQQVGVGEVIPHGVEVKVRGEPGIDGDALLDRQQRVDEHSVLDHHGKFLRM